MLRSLVVSCALLSECACPATPHASPTIAAPPTDAVVVQVENTPRTDAAAAASSSTGERGAGLVARWHPGDASVPAAYAFSLDGADSRGAELDLDGDGEPELLVWAPSGALSGYARRAGTIRELQRPIWILAGAADLDQARARLPLLRGYNAPADGVTAAQILLSMHLATNAQLRALVAPAGLNVCTVHSGNYRPHSRRCHRTNGLQLTAAWLFTELLLDRTFADVEGQAYRVRERTDGSYVPSMPTCAVVSGGFSCEANMSGPGLFVWAFEGSGASMRLRELAHDSYEDN